MDSFIYLTLGLMAGFAGGLLGIGGGTLILPVLRFIVSLPMGIANGTSVIASFCTAITSKLGHLQLKNTNYTEIWPIILSGACGTTIFSIYYEKSLKTPMLIDYLTGGTLLIVASKMLYDTLYKKNSTLVPYKFLKNTTISNMLKVTIGLLASIFPAILGIGGGVFLVPTFIYLFRFSTKKAIASSIATFTINALISSSFKISQGFINYSIALPLCIGCIAGAIPGTWLTTKLSASKLKLIFALYLIYFASKFLHI